MPKVVEKVEEVVQPKTVIAKMKTSEAKQPKNKTAQVVVKAPNSTSTSQRVLNKPHSNVTAAIIAAKAA